MNWLDQILGSNAFKAIFPVQGLAQGATQALTGMRPTQQYAAGAVGGTGIAGLGALMGGSAGMTPYMPTSAPNMGAAGSSLGPGGMFSSLNPMGSSGTGASGGSSSLATALKLMRMLPQGGGGGQQQQPAQQRQNQEMQMRLIYQMFPNLRPGAQLHQGGNSQWQS